MSYSELIINIGFSICLVANAALFIPQIFALLKVKSSEGVSLFTFLGFNVIQLFTFFHGWIVNDLILAVGSILSLITCGTVSWLIAYYKYFQKKSLDNVVR
ncbi:PQ-loop domain-containing transporter [Legionella sp. 227]|uniref:PQ-loop domain-containing transporter n=1 Tax=Legionella sp. 227 TaxID=3367288 RepID=UPI00370D078B